MNAFSSETIIVFLRLSTRVRRHCYKDSRAGVSSDGRNCNRNTFACTRATAAGAYTGKGHDERSITSCCHNERIASHGRYCADKILLPFAIASKTILCNVSTWAVRTWIWIFYPCRTSRNKFRKIESVFRLPGNAHHHNRLQTFETRVPLT